MNKDQLQEKGKHKANKKVKSVKRKNDCKPISDQLLDGFVDNHKKIFKTMSSQLQNVSEEKEYLHTHHLEKEKVIIDLNERLHNKEVDLKNLENQLQTVIENYRTALADFSKIKENFFQYEIKNDEFFKSHMQENEELKNQLQAQQTEKTDLNKNFADLQMQLQNKCAENSDIFAELQKCREEITKIHAEKILYKKQQELEIKILQENHEQEIKKLKLENLQKEETFMQFKNHAEAEDNEKNRLIQELKFKISNIERLLDQPARSVQPRVEIQPPSSSTSKLKESNNNNVGVTKPQHRDAASAENQQQQENVTNAVRFKRPNNKENKTTLTRKRRGDLGTARNPSPPLISSQSSNKKASVNTKTNRVVNKPVYSSSLSDGNEDDSDDSIGFWRPSMMENSDDDSCIIQETSDASESFSKVKRSKK